MRPDDLDDLDPIEPDDAQLTRVHARGGALRRCRRGQRLGSVAVAVVVVAVGVGVALTVGGTSHNNVTGPVSTSTAPTTSTAPPAGMTAHLVLPVTTIRAGSSMSGRVVVDNNTGRARHVVGCGGIFAVTLSNAEGGQGSMAWASCAMNITIPVGTSTYPVTVDATYLECGGTASPTMHACIDNREPPLPPGVYQAALAQSTTVVPTPPTVPVTVVARDDTSVDGLRATALAWSRAFLTGTASDIFAMEGSECLPQTSTTLSTGVVTQYLAGERATMKRYFGMPLDQITAHGVSVRNVTGTAGEARVQYDLPATKTGNDGWVTYTVEDGEWKVSDCHAPMSSSSSASSSARRLGTP